MFVAAEDLLDGHYVKLRLMCHVQYMRVNQLISRPFYTHFQLIYLF